jgi:hypothetical protein
MDTTLSRLADRVLSVCGKRPVALEPVQGGGYSLALRLKATFPDASTAFVKAATNPWTTGFLRQERHAYTHLGTQPFLPEFLGFDDGDDRNLPLMVLEDLTGAFWPPPWTPARIDAVRATLEQVHAIVPPPGLPTLEADHRQSLTCWHEVAESPALFLALGLCDATWLERALPRLLEAEAALDLSGEALLHMDIRSDNLCFRADGSAVIVDWNWACSGAANADLACWVPSLASEGGPLPETLLPHGGPWAAGLAGYFAAHAGLPPPEGAPRVREVQLSQLKTSLPWAARALGLPPLP